MIDIALVVLNIKKTLYIRKCSLDPVQVLTLDLSDLHSLIGLQNNTEKGISLGH